MYKSFFEKDITNLGSEKLESLRKERDTVSGVIAYFTDLLNQENRLEENQKDYILIKELEKEISDKRIELNTIDSEIEEFNESI